MAKVKVRRASREELPGLAVLRDSIQAEMPAFAPSAGVLDLDMEVDPSLGHLMAHDPDGFKTAVLKDETLGFAAAHVRARQCVLSDLWVLPQHRGTGAGEALISRVLGYGEQSGAREYMALAPAEGGIQSLLLRHHFEPLVPVYLFRIAVERAARLAASLSRQLTGRDMTEDLLNRKGQADLDRIDRLSRNVTRQVDHLFWLKERQRRVAFVRQGSRIAAYAYGSADLVGPVAGATQDAALCALGWAMDFALRETRSPTLELRVPARFVAAVDALQDAGARLDATFIVYGRGLKLVLDRCLFATHSLP